MSKLSDFIQIIKLIRVLFFNSPIGEVFRARLRQFPSLVTCCTIDWFSEWPEQALISVANTFISEMPEVDPKHTNVVGLVGSFNDIFCCRFIFGT